MTQEQIEKLRNELIEHKCIASTEYGDDDAFVGVYFQDLCNFIDKVIAN